MTSTDILDNLAKIYGDAEHSYRDRMLQVGRLIHEYLLAFLREADTAFSPKKKPGRSAGLRVVSDRLGIKGFRVTHLLWAAMAADLLGGGECGGLYLHSIVMFARFIRRKGFSTARSAVRDEITKSPRYAGRSMTVFEEWEIKPQCRESAPPLFRRAATEGWSTVRVRDEVNQIATGYERIAARSRLTPIQADAVEKIHDRARIGQPQDVAEMLFDIIKDAEAPQAIVDHLSRLVKEMPKRHKYSFAS